MQKMIRQRKYTKMPRVVMYRLLMGIFFSNPPFLSLLLKLNIVSNRIMLKNTLCKPYTQLSKGLRIDKVIVTCK